VSPCSRTVIMTDIRYLTEKNLTKKMKYHKKYRCLLKKAPKVFGEGFFLQEAV